MSSGLRTMTGPGSHETHSLRPDRKSAPRTIEALPYARLVSAGSQRAVPSLPPQPLSRDLPNNSLTAGSSASASKPVAPLTAPQRTAQDKLRAALGLLDRGARLTMDAVIILVFSPVIGIWWLMERRRHRKSSR